MIDILRRARNDIDDRAEELDERSGPAEAGRFHAEVNALLARLASSPGLFGPVDPPYRKYLGMRVAPVPGFPPWLVFYAPAPGGVRVLRVVHGARDLDAIFG